MLRDAFYAEDEKTIPWLTEQRRKEQERNAKSILPNHIHKTGIIMAQEISEISQPDTVLTKLIKRHLSTIIYRRLLQARKGRLAKRIRRKSTNKSKKLIQDLSKMLVEIYMYRNRGRFDCGKDEDSDTMKPLNKDEEFRIDRLFGGGKIIQAFSRDLNMVVTSLDRTR